MTQKVNHLCSDWLILEYEYETKLVLKNLMTVRSDGKSTTFVYVNILKFDYLHSQRDEGPFMEIKLISDVFNLIHVMNDHYGIYPIYQKLITQTYK
jgi:hypothetical protein